MAKASSELIRVRNNMRIGAKSLSADIAAFESKHLGSIEIVDPTILRLKWWCEQLLHELEHPRTGQPGIPSFGDICEVPDPAPLFTEQPRNGYVRR